MKRTIKSGSMVSLYDEIRGDLVDAMLSELEPFRNEDPDTVKTAFVDACKQVLKNLYGADFRGYFSK